MALFRPFCRTVFVFSLLATASMAPRLGRGAADAATPAPPREQAKAQDLPPGVKISAQHIGADETSGAIVAEGAVTIESGFGRIQADRITFREGHIIEAEGDILLVWGNNRISGTRMTYDMGQADDPDPDKRVARGVIENAVGQVDPEFYFDARQVDTIGDDRVVLHDATVTTCTQPVPYWSFRVSTAKIRLEGYAHMFNLRPTVKNVPFFYLPYLLWPVKRERAPGLLFPELGSTSTRGRVVSLPVFIPLGASADLTVFPEYYTIAGWGGGAKLRAIPNRDGYLETDAQYIADDVTGSGRYRFQFKQTQSFLSGFRMVSDVDIVSDFDYFTDFVRNLTYASSPTILGRMAFTRSGPWTTILIQELYREQLFSGGGSTLVQTTLPEIEWRGRSRRIGESPIYFTYTSSFASIRQSSDRLQASYLRGDVAPTFSAPFSPRPWIDITPAIALRSTYWTQRLSPPDLQGASTVLDEGIWRNLFAAGIDFRGPKLFRIFETRPKPGKNGGGPVPARKYKHTVEPRISYSYQKAYDRNDEIIVFDENDRFGTNANNVVYGLTSRLIGQRPRASAEAQGASGEQILVPEGESGKLREATSGTPDAGDAARVSAPAQDEKDAPLEPIEIASLDLTQSRSFNSDLLTGDINGDCLLASPAPAGCREASHYSAVSLTARYNPSRNTSLNVGSRYDVLFGTISEVSVSGNFRTRMAQGLFSLVHQRGLGFVQVATPKPDSTQLRFQGNFGPLAGRIRIGVDGTYNFTPAPKEKHLPYRRWRLEYYTQCCGFLTEYLVSQYSTFPRREFRFAVDLRGIGKLFDFNQANQ